MNRRWMLAGAALLACWPIVRAEPPATGPATTQAVSSAEGPVFAVLDYFQQHCAGCHGAYGKYYLPRLSDRHPGAQLRAILKEMADGPAQAPLEDAQLGQLVKYHQSLIAGQPYMAITGREGTIIHGEVSPGNQVIIEIGENRIDAAVTGHRWEANIPENVDAREIGIRVQREGEER